MREFDVQIGRPVELVIDGSRIPFAAGALRVPDFVAERLKNTYPEDVTIVGVYRPAPTVAPKAAAKPTVKKPTKKPTPRRK